MGEIGLGCWQLGGDWGTVGEDDARAILRAAYASGTTFFDTADVYGAGLSERRIGAWLAEERPDGVFIATKQGRFSPPGWPQNFTKAALRAHAEASRERLGVETLDLLQLHCIPTDVLRDGAVFDHLRALQQDGIIARFGASVESVEEALLCLAQPDLASLQIIFNLFRQKPIDTLFAAAKETGTALIVRLPLASGLLSGKFTAATVFDASDHRHYNRDGAAFNVGETFAGLPFETGVALADGLKPLVPDGLSLAQTAQRWCLDFDAVTVLIPGATSPEQARRNAAVSALAPLDAAVHARLRAFYEENVAAHIRGPY